MPGIAESNSPSYISSQSANVILSDVRPFKLQSEALHAINVFLDEFLYSILDKSSSLSTDKLRASLLNLLPTSLGKEALLEAEVELRAYWDRTTGEDEPAPACEDDSTTFYLEWVFELLRLKCEAYSTLNEFDEDPDVEICIQQRFKQYVVTPPNAVLLPGAALYLTAILEAMCEHILTNVGRVAARDSSRTIATVNDLFTALCEDDSIYGLFKSMRVYERIELLSKIPSKSRRSKSFTHSDAGNTLNSRTNSPHRDSLPKKESMSMPRLSSEVSPSVPHMAVVMAAGSRTSLDKSRSTNFKKSLESESLGGAIGHKKSESFFTDEERSLAEDSVLQQEFDDLMRSSATMKVHKQDKDKKSRRPAPISFNKSTDSISSKTQSLRAVNSILEEEELAFPQPPLSTLPMQQEFVVPPTNPGVNNRTRSLSTPGVNNRSKRKQPPPIPSSFPHTMARDIRSDDPPGFPPRTRKRQTNRESMDLDDIMAGSDNEEIPAVPPVPSPPTRSPVVSKSTRDLMDFLAQGPPDDFTKPGGELRGTLTLGHNANSPSFDTKPKGAKLRRMISLLNIGNAEKSRAGTHAPRTPATIAKPRPFPVAVTPIPPRLANQTSLSGLSSLANRPIPPRPPRQPDPPSDHEISPPPSPRLPPETIRSSSSIITHSNRPPSPALVPPRRASREKESSFNGSANGHKHAADLVSSDAVAIELSCQAAANLTYSHQERKDRTILTVDSSVQSGPTVGLSPNDVRHLYRLVSGATSADECRLILDMFIAKHEIPIEPPNTSSKSSNPEPSEDVPLEQSLVGFLLGEEPLIDDGARVSLELNGTSGSVDLDDAGTRSQASITPLPLSDDPDDPKLAQLE
ncbi:hypothetical protein AGABI2DRAFT_122626 [Agaricus bisporus var. bisporus H97]|uniref:hypothetical protein n=1 Tax=Agaricus bisporus var. bisporus (strain H97 / ATCC MYA-4626 / FGSC 10389) TaxID=936046 RepID=UPI00029F71CE|nr:hypothetical protein AGABI2DRAFT_122626 [Agaricus bisporus var. bisporus H97]EKV42399.1 hypothetical protein AGABI2DRAFT_122626 [Agaricus bisporus var. bisporus H97]